MALETEFETAQARVRTLSTDPGDEVKLRLYAWYKQATEGDVSGSRPGVFNPVARAKYDAWARVSGNSADEARAQYIEIVDDITSAE